jgi:hypothetical protein
MRLTTGARLGPYEVLCTLGAGGMGEVYRARDTRLERDVAIKVLPETFTSDQDRLARFQREAKVLASLNHPNIAAIYGIEDANASHALVMELVDGPTLANRIAQGPIAISEALSISRQIAEALASAHDCGIVHRDLKPANIKLRPDGTVKLLDFGIAKAMEPADRISADLDDTPTITSPAMTQAGVILGTAAYMSPEQARGQRVNAQTDIWAFGCVLYEMLTGRATFGRATSTDTIAAVIEREPDWAALPRTTPVSVARLLRRTLEKDPSRRLHAIADARLDLLDVDDARDASMAPPDVAPAKRSGRFIKLTLGAAAIIVVLLGADALRRMRGGEPTSTGTATRTSIDVLGQVIPQLSVAVSPDGRRLAYVATDAVGSRLWVRDLDALAPHALAGTEDAAHPFWKPDGSAIGFVASGKLKRVDSRGGQVLKLADEAIRGGAAWSSTGVILFRRQPGELATVPETGGSVSTVVKAPSGSWPAFLPDGRQFIFHVRGDGVYAGSIGSETTKLLIKNDFGAVFAEPNYLVFGRADGLVFAQHFDPTRLEVTGEPLPVAEGVWEALAAARVSVSATAGVLAYINASVANNQLAWFDRSGRPGGVLGEPGLFAGQSPRLSPDGAYVALTRGFAGIAGSPDAGIWVTRLADGDNRRLALEPLASRPAWSHDSARILFQWARAASEGAVSIKDVRGTEAARLVGGVRGTVWDWSPDGQRIVVGTGSPSDLWIVPVAGGDPIPFARSPFNKTQAQISPDSHWITYTALDTGHDEVYVDSFPVATNRRQVSVGGGVQPRWRRDGSELFYLGPDQKLMAVPVTIKSGYFDHGRPTQLFQTRLGTAGSQISGLGAFYDVTPDGQRFLLNGPPADPGPQITVVLNWTAGLNAKR